jgi:hypothetical protein
MLEGCEIIERQLSLHLRMPSPHDRDIALVKQSSRPQRRRRRRGRHHGEVNRTGLHLLAQQVAIELADGDPQFRRADAQVERQRRDDGDLDIVGAGDRDGEVGGRGIEAASPRQYILHLVKRPSHRRFKFDRSCGGRHAALRRQEQRVRRDRAAAQAVRSAPAGSDRAGALPA